MCRKQFGNTQSLLMDQATFDAHIHLLTLGKRTEAILPNLPPAENALFTLLEKNGWRIEQERLDEAWVNCPDSVPRRRAGLNKSYSRVHLPDSTSASTFMLRSRRSQIGWFFSRIEAVIL